MENNKTITIFQGIMLFIILYAIYTIVGRDVPMMMNTIEYVALVGARINALVMIVVMGIGILFLEMKRGKE